MCSSLTTMDQHILDGIRVRTIPHESPEGKVIPMINAGAPEMVTYVQ